MEFEMKLVLTVVLLASLGFGLGTPNIETVPSEVTTDEAPTVAEIMQTLHKKDKLHSVVSSGKAKDEQKVQLLDLYLHMADAKPANGQTEKWAAELQPIIHAAAKVVVGREGAADEYKKAVNCTSCHDKFKRQW